MNKDQLVSTVWLRLQAVNPEATRREAMAAVNAVLDVVQETVATGEPVAVTGFGTFEVRDRGERQARNPRTGTPVTIEARRVPAFRPGKVFKAAVNGTAA